MKKKLMSGICLALLAAMCLGVTAYALTPAPTENLDPPMPDQPYYVNEPPLIIDLQTDVSVAGKMSNYYGAGDILVLRGTLYNNSDEDLSGKIWMAWPDGVGGKIIAGPSLPLSENGQCYVVDKLQAHASIDCVFVLRAPADCETPDWVLTTTFAVDDGGGCIATTAEAHFGHPDLKADKKSLLKDGVLKIRNEGNGGASRVKFRFLAKKDWQKDEGLPGMAKYAGDGRIEVDVGGIAARGKIELDISGLIHQRMDPKGPIEIVYEAETEEAMPDENWVED